MDTFDPLITEPPPVIVEKPVEAPIVSSDHILELTREKYGGSVDVEKLVAYAKLMATDSDIAHMMDVDVDVIKKKFAGLTGKARAAGRIILLKAQMKKAVKKLDSGMLIHLGKNYLGQSDKMDVTSGGNEIEFTFDLGRQLPKFVESTVKE